LLEIIPAAATDPAITQRIRTFVEETLGKSVVVCHDTPNFIANRMVSYIMADAISFAVDNGYTVEEVDALTGPLLGRPRSGTFRLNDVVGIDVWAMIALNLHPLIPHDPDRDTLIAPSYLNILQTLIDHGHLGPKSGQGFYQTRTAENGEKSFWALDLAAALDGKIAYLPPQNPTWPAVEALRRKPLPERVAALVALPDRAGAFIWHTLARTLAYAAARLPEIADSPLDIDRVMEWGFAWELGPFALWDAIGVAQSVARMKSEGIDVAPWVEKMLDAGYSTFYHQEGGVRQLYDLSSGAYRDIPQDPRIESVAALKTSHPLIAENDAASLLDSGDGILLFEFHSKMNALNSAFFPILEEAINRLHANATGLIIANDGPHFSVGANLHSILASAEAGDWEAIEQLIAGGQRLFLALRAAPKPVVAAPFQRVLGGGAEICLASHRVVAHAETNIGLVEFNVGLIPGWGGCKEMVRRDVRSAEPLSGLRSIMELVIQAKTSTSAVDAKGMGLLAAQDEVVMHRGHLIHAARQAVVKLAEGFTAAAITNNVYAAGADALSTLQAEIREQHEAGKLLAHDKVIANALAEVLCGGPGAAGWRNEEYFLELERQQFLQLVSTPATQARIRQILASGKPLRN
jgi:3-hydroxyacyl-CoA dehydrogenase